MTQKTLADNIIWGAPSFWINVFPVYFAKYKGLFHERGINIDVKFFHGGPELTEAVKKGEIQVGNIGLPPFLKAFEEGLPARIIGSAAVQRLDIFLVSQPEIKKISDLKGKKIGILSMGSCDSYFIRRILEKESLDPEDVQLVPLQESYGDLRVITSKQVDSTFLVEPKVTLGESTAALNVLAHVGDYFPQYQWNVLFAKEDLIADNRVLLDRILEAYRRSSRSIKEASEEVLEFGSRLFDMQKDLFKVALEGTLVNWHTEARIDCAGLENAIRIQREMGAIRADIKKEDLVSQL